MRVLSGSEIGLGVRLGSALTLVAALLGLVWALNTSSSLTRIEFLALSCAFAVLILALVVVAASLLRHRPAGTPMNTDPKSEEMRFLARRISSKLKRDTDKQTRE